MYLSNCKSKLIGVRIVSVFCIVLTVDKVYTCEASGLYLSNLKEKQ